MPLVEKARTGNARASLFEIAGKGYDITGRLERFEERERESGHLNQTTSLSCFVSGGGARRL
jgi:hypothetical protein